MEYITTKEAAAKWGISATRVTILANEERIPGAQRLGKSWLIPAGATKPPEFKANHSNSAKTKANRFSFPLYHFRPDCSNVKKAQLSAQQQNLFLAESNVLECRFAEAYPLLKSLLLAPDDKITEIGCLWNAGICCIALNKPEDFSRIFLRLQLLLSEDFPHRDDLVIILDILKTFVDTIGSFANKETFNAEIHDQCLPLACMKIGYANLSREIMKPGSADTTLLELNLRLLKTTGAIVTIEIMHCHLLGIYNIRNDHAAAEKHADALVQLTFENKLYFPLVTYFQYFAPVLSPILARYPEDFQNHIHELSAQYEKNYTAFLSSISDYSVIAKLTEAEHAYVYAVMMDFPNTVIADNLGVSQQTVTRKLAIICEKFGVSNKKELRDFLHNCL